jgi:hypothetical protein
MRAILRLHQGIEADIDHYTETTLPPLQHQWPLLGKELFTLEHTHTNTPGKDHPPLTEQEKRERREAIRHGILAQLYRDEETQCLDKGYLAFLLLKQGRGAVIVGDPSALGERIKARVPSAWLLRISKDTVERSLSAHSLRTAPTCPARIPRAILNT